MMMQIHVPKICPELYTTILNVKIVLAEVW